MREAIGGTRWHSVALGGTWWQSVAIGGPQWHTARSTCMTYWATVARMERAAFSSSAELHAVSVFHVSSSGE